MSSTRLTIDPPPLFHFASAAYSHGWVVLAPTSWDEIRRAVRRVEELAGGRIVVLDITGNDDIHQPRVDIDVRHEGELAETEAAEVIRRVRHMFRLDEDFAGFYSLCRAKGDPWARATFGFGRMLRSPTLFEDVVKTIATTNTTWSGAKRMIAGLVAAAGRPFPGEPSLRAFPTPEALAGAPASVFTEAARFGYRGPFVQELARRVVSGEYDLEGLLDSDLPTPALRKHLLAIKGVGPYAAATLLMLIGRYDEIGCDTVFRDFVSRKYFGGDRRPVKELLAVYDGWGKWRHLAYWFDLWQGPSEQL